MAGRSKKPDRSSRKSWRGGEFDDATFQELHRFAAALVARYGKRRMADTSSLIGEAVYRLRGRSASLWKSHRHFLFAARRTMESVLIDRFRKQKKFNAIALEDARNVAARDMHVVEMARICRVIESLEKIDPKYREIFQCKAIDRMTDAEAAKAVGVSVRTIQRKWKFARAVIRDRLGSPRSRSRSSSPRGAAP